MIEDVNPDQDKIKTKKDHEDNLRILSNILEQNFLEKTKNDNVRLNGVSCGIVLKSVYRFQADKARPYYVELIHESDAIKKGDEIATKLAKDVREIEGLEEVPLMIALYQEESISSQVPGNFIKKVNVKEGSNELGKWEDLKEEYVLFPSSESKEDYID